MNDAGQEKSDRPATGIPLGRIDRRAEGKSDRRFERDTAVAIGRVRFEQREGLRLAHRRARKNLQEAQRKKDGVLK